MPDWKLFITNPQNKGILMHFISKMLCDNKASLIPPDYIILGNDGNKTVLLMANVQRTICELLCE